MNNNAVGEVYGGEMSIKTRKAVARAVDEIKKTSSDIDRVLKSDIVKDCVGIIVVTLFKLIMLPMINIVGIFKTNFDWLWNNQSPYDFSKWYLLFKK